MPVPSLSIDDALLERVDIDRYNTPRSEWFRDAARTQLLVHEIEDHNADLPDGWVEEALYAYIERRAAQPAEAD